MKPQIIAAGRFPHLQRFTDDILLYCLESLDNLFNLPFYRLPKYGLCGVIGYYPVVEAIAPTWPYYSGSKGYPVPDPKHPGDPHAAISIYIKKQRYRLLYWGRYGKLRKSLAAHIHDQLTLEILIRAVNKREYLQVTEEAK